jgi:hypothetical protein
MPRSPIEWGGTPPHALPMGQKAHWSAWPAELRQIMVLRSLSAFCVLALCFSGVSASACGSSDAKKNAPRYSGGGEGGAATGEAGEGGTGGLVGIAGDSSGGTLTDAGATGSTSAGGAGAGPVEPNGGASEGGAGGADTETPFRGLYIGEDGDDAAPGTPEAPFATLAHAASVAKAGETIVFLDGSYTVGSVAVIPAGVDLMASTSGGATLTGSGTLLNLSGDTRIEGLKFQSYTRVAYFGAGAAASGTVTIVDSTFINCATGLELSGSVAAVVSAGSAAVVGNGGNAFAVLSHSASLDMTGGILRNYDAGGIVRAATDSRVSLTDVRVEDGTGTVLTLRNDAVAELSGVTIATLGHTLIEQRDESELAINDSDLSIKPAAATVYYCVSNIVNGTGSLTITDSSLHGCGTAIRGGIYETMTITNVDFTDLAFGGMDLGVGASGVGGTIRITGSSFDELGYVALRIGSTGNLNDFKIRDSSFNCGSATQWGCLVFNGSNASTMDLGTVSDPGGNTFLHGNATQTAVQFQFQAVDITAVGNTWIPDVQGANAEGKYTAPAGSGNQLLVTKTTATERNYSMPYGGTLLLAENP